MHRLATIAAALMLTALLTACGEADDVVSPTEPTGTPQPTPVPASSEVVFPVEPDGGIGDGAEPPEKMTTLTGRLGGDAQLEGGCAWLDTADGTRYEVQYPSGYEVDVDALVLRDPDGEVIAAGGEEVTVTGSIGEDLMSICQIGTIFVAETVEAP